MSDQPPQATPPPGAPDPAAGQAGDPTAPPPVAPTPPSTDGPQFAPTPPSTVGDAQVAPTPPSAVGDAPGAPTSPPSDGSPAAAAPAGDASPSVGAASPAAGMPGSTPTGDAAGAQQPQGWVLPPTGGFPAGAGPYGGQPWYPGAPVVYPGAQFAYPGQQPGHGWYPPGIDPADPLVTPPGGGVSGWFDRCVGAVRRGWRLLLPILLLTQVLPAVVVSVVTLVLDPTAKWEESTADDPTALPDTFLADTGLLLAVVLGSALVFGLVQSLGWAAGTWVVTRQAAGEPVSLGAALAYGARRALGLWGWTLVMSLIIGLGICFCVIPGIYFAFALSMAGPVYLFERQHPIGRSYRMFHDRLGMLLGRVALVAAAVIVGSGAAGMVEGVGSLPFGTTPLESAGTAVGVLAVTLVGGVLALPAHLAQLVGLVVTYAEQRVQEGPVDSARLAGELG
ncbi:hypothetical protein GA0070606_3743 [Micromonospora citrea]|uniref:Membrane domain of glycerophosphoryl diester phosphodiesterase n=1 Tax=Micromonospora citrea TaxID=47855 RepID=A0A1C6VA27_9ACTN|nr:hypothetical protein [Micromonospora citrea]SCL63125.1 hypothetical protein GA0070606_3743 [Micromonospora citrea]